MFFPNWGGFSDIVFSLGLIAIALFIIVLVLIIVLNFSSDMDTIELGVLAVFFAVVGLLCLAAGYFTEIGIHHTDQARERHEQQAVRDLKHQGFIVIEIGYDATYAVIRSDGCQWEYDIDYRGGKYVLIRGSGAVVSSPPVKPSEVGRDDPNLICAKPA